MKIWFKSAVSIVLGILILLSGSGITLAKMVCLKSGSVSISFAAPEDCCGEEDCDDQAVIEERCCDISNVSIAVLEYVGASTQSFEKSNIWFNAPIILPLLDCARSDKNAMHTIFLKNQPPKLFSPPIRIFTKTFLI